MAQPTTRATLIEYCKRKLGAPVLEINVADEQIDDLVDDAIQFFQERHLMASIRHITSTKSLNQISIEVEVEVGPTLR